jgi:hypothetical protein
MLCHEILTSSPTTMGLGNTSVTGRRRSDLRVARVYQDKEKKTKSNKPNPRSTSSSKQRIHVTMAIVVELAL